MSRPRLAKALVQEFPGTGATRRPCGTGRTCRAPGRKVTSHRRRAVKKKWISFDCFGRNPAECKDIRPVSFKAVTAKGIFEPMKLLAEHSQKAEQDSEGSAAVCCAVVYEDTASRDRALRLCDDLVRNLWNDFDFDFSWWRFDYLEDPAIARLAAESALWSDITMFSSGSVSDLPVPVRKWVDDWSHRRLADAAVLVALVGAGANPGDTPVHFYLRQKAAQAHMDFLPPPSGMLLANSKITL